MADIQTNRNIRLSIRAEVVTQLGNMGYTNVYDESDMRETITPTIPYIYVVDQMVRPMATKLPFMVIEIRPIIGKQFEVGNRSGKTFTCYLHIFGQNRGVRDDIASYLQENLPMGITYSNYTSGSAVDYGRGKIEVQDTPTVDEYAVPSDKVEEASITNWSVVRFTAKVKQ